MSSITCQEPGGLDEARPRCWQQSDPRGWAMPVLIWSPNERLAGNRFQLAGLSDRELGWRWGGDPTARPPDRKRYDTQIDQPAQ